MLKKIKELQDFEGARHEEEHAKVFEADEKLHLAELKL